MGKKKKDFMLLKEKYSKTRQECVYIILAQLF
jgi:hypothetical protein